jgi:hypothetical protein
MLDRVGVAATVDELVARAAITDTLKRSARGADRASREFMLSCYHPDAIDDHGVFIGSPAALADDSFTEPLRHDRTTHFLSDPYIRFDGNKAFVETNCLAHHWLPPDAAGDRTLWIVGLRYMDRFEQRDGRWLIAFRKVIYDWEYTIEVSAADHRLPAELLTGRRDDSDPWYDEFDRYQES